MQKFLYSFGSAIMMAMGFSSCTPSCVRCTYKEDTFVMCEEDYPHKQTYNAYIGILEADGYKCSGTSEESTGLVENPGNRASNTNP